MFNEETERKLNRLEALRDRHKELAAKAEEARVELVDAIFGMYPADGSQPPYGLPSEVARRSGYTREYIGQMRKAARVAAEKAGPAEPAEESAQAEA